jgi:phosphatidylserine decarboxylase
MSTIEKKTEENAERIPYAIQSSWLPKHGSKSMQTYFNEILNAELVEWHPCVKALGVFIEGNEVVKEMVQSACDENLNIIDAHLKSADGVPIPRIKDMYTLLNAFNAILTRAPAFINDDLVGLPFSAFVVGIDPTLSGSELFRMPAFNEKMGAILQEWNKFLASGASNTGFRVEGKQWLSDVAKKQYDFPIWEKDSQTLPYWNSWNSFFTRKFKDKKISRPIDHPHKDQVVNSANDGSLFRWRPDISKKDVFWFKDMEYSLSDILSSSVIDQQTTIDNYNLVDMFSGGSIFQTYLNPYNFHRWWVPVDGEVLFDPFSIPGCFFNKLVLPDFGGATTASLPYLAQVNARGLIVIKTKNYGHVCCIPLGMSEVSTVQFDDTMTQGTSVKKGDEMGMFNYGGSSFVLIFEKVPGKKLSFEDASGMPYMQDPPLPDGSAGSGGQPTLIGAQIGVWKNA